MGINVASLFASIGVNTDPLQKGLGGAKQSLQGFGSEMAKQVIGAASLATAVYKVGQTVVDSIRDWADYADGMRLAAQMAGVTTEEMSRLTQAADDFRVPIETMQRSMEMALKNGFVPTIANIADLSDKLLGIADPAARAAAASKIFGKSYADMMPFLLAGGDAIRDGTAAIADNLVVTQKAAQDAKAYKDAVDELGDAWTGVKNELGQKLLPVLTDVFNQINDSNSISELRQQLGDAATAAKAAGLITKEHYNAVMLEAYDRTKTTAEQVAYLESRLASLTGPSETASTAVGNMTTAINGVDLSAARDEYLETAAVLREDLAGAYDAVKSAEDTWKSGVAGQIKVELDEKKAAGGLDTKGYIAALETLDNYAGTQFAYDFKIAESIPDLVKTLLEDPEAFMSKMSGFESSMMPLDKAVSASMLLVQELQTKLINLERTYTAYVDVIMGKGTGVPNYSGPNKVLPEMRAGGGSVEGGTPYIVGERGPELFVPSGSGNIMTNAETANVLGGGNGDLNQIVSRIPTARDIAVAVRDALLLVG